MPAKLSAFVIMLLISCSLLAQTTINWGPKAGLNLAMQYGTKGQDQGFNVKTKLRPGAMAGAYLDLVIIPNFSLGYELLYSMKGSRETITINRMEIDGVMENLPKPAVMEVQYNLDYIELPVLLKVKLIDLPAFSLTAISGTAVSIKVKGSHKLDGKVYLPDGEDFSTIIIHEESNLGEVNMFDYSFVYGGTLDLKTKIPLHLEYRFTLGWDYLSLPTYQFSDPVQLRNQTYSLGLSLGF